MSILSKIMWAAIITWAICAFQTMSSHWAYGQVTGTLGKSRVNFYSSLRGNYSQPHAKNQVSQSCQRRALRPLTIWLRSSRRHLQLLEHQGKFPEQWWPGCRERGPHNTVAEAISSHGNTTPWESCIVSSCHSRQQKLALGVGHPESRRSKDRKVWVS